MCYFRDIPRHDSNNSSTERRTFNMLEPADMAEINGFLKSQKIDFRYHPFTKVTRLPKQRVGSLTPNRTKSHQASYKQGVPDGSLQTRKLWVIVVKIKLLNIRFRIDLWQISSLGSKS